MEDVARVELRQRGGSRRARVGRRSRSGDGDWLNCGCSGRGVGGEAVEREDGARGEEKSRSRSSGSGGGDSWSGDGSSASGCRKTWEV